MIGKKNVVFGLVYLALTAALGGVMILGYFDDRQDADNIVREKIGLLQQIAIDNYEIDLEPVTPTQLARANTEAILALSSRNNAQKPINRIRSGPHTHGTAEALINIVIGVLLIFIAVPVWFKQVISWTFIVGTLLHSGMLYMGMALGQSWAGLFLNGPPGAIGRGLILLGLVMAAIATAIGFRATPVTD